MTGRSKLAAKARKRYLDLVLDRISNKEKENKFPLGTQVLVWLIDNFYGLQSFRSDKRVLSPKPRCPSYRVTKASAIDFIGSRWNKSFVFIF